MFILFFQILIGWNFQDKKLEEGFWTFTLKLQWQTFILYHGLKFSSSPLSQKQEQEQKPQKFSCTPGQEIFGHKPPGRLA